MRNTKSHDWKEKIVKIHIDKKRAEVFFDLDIFIADHFPNQGNEIGDLFQGKNITVEIKESKDWYTRAQQNYYWKWCREFGLWCGMTPDEIHDELLCRCYGSEEIKTRMGVRRRPLKRSSEASRKNHSALIDTLVRTAAEMGFIVPISEEFDGEESFQK